MARTGKKSGEFSPQTVLKRKNDQLFSEIDGEVVMLSIENSEYYGMDRVGSHIWQLLEEGITWKHLITTLLDEYEIDEEQCKKDTLTFIEQLADKKLVDVTIPKDKQRHG